MRYMSLVGRSFTSKATRIDLKNCAPMYLINVEPILAYVRTDGDSTLEAILARTRRFQAGQTSLDVIAQARASDVVSAGQAGQGCGVP
jgi:hypothetical protein